MSPAPNCHLIQGTTWSSSMYILGRIVAFGNDFCHECIDVLLCVGETVQVKQEYRNYQSITCQAARLSVYCGPAVLRCEVPSIQVVSNRGGKGGELRYDEVQPVLLRWPGVLRAVDSLVSTRSAHCGPAVLRCEVTLATPR